VSWTRFLDDFVRHIPSGAWIRSFNAQLTPTTPTPAAKAAGSANGAAAGIGTLQVTVTGLDFPDAADWLREVAGDPSLSSVMITGAVSRNLDGSAATVGFNSSATITPAARSDRAARLTKAAL
jgi:hypothetical protein